MAKRLWISIFLLTAVANAQQSDIAVLAADAPAEAATPSPVSFNFKGYLKVEENVFDTENDSVREMTWRFDPAWKWQNVQFGFRQEIKGVTGDNQYLDNTRFFVGPTPFKLSSAVNVQPLIRYYAPIRITERNKGFNGAVEPAVKTNFTLGKLKATWDVGFRQLSYRQKANVNRDKLAQYAIKNELEGTYPIHGAFGLRMKFEFEDTWNHASRWEQGFKWEQGVGYQMTEHFQWEIGHQIAIKTASATDDRRSPEWHDKKDSEMFTRLNLVY